MQSPQSVSALFYTKLKEASRVRMFKPNIVPETGKMFLVLKFAPH